jgi:hypothetical protein
VQRVRIARRNKLLTSALSGKPEESAKEGLSEPSEGIFGRFFKIREFRRPAIGFGIERRNEGLGERSSLAPLRSIFGLILQNRADSPQVTPADL